MRTRNSLHKSKLDDFRGYLESFGWIDQKLKGDYEVLRMTHPKHNGVLLAYAKLNAREHFTIDGIAYDMFRKWMRERGST